MWGQVSGSRLTGQQSTWTGLGLGSGGLGQGQVGPDTCLVLVRPRGLAGPLMGLVHKLGAAVGSWWTSRCRSMDRRCGLRWTASTSFLSHLGSRWD